MPMRPEPLKPPEATRIARLANGAVVEWDCLTDEYYETTLDMWVTLTDTQAGHNKLVPVHTSIGTASTAITCYKLEV